RQNKNNAPTGKAISAEIQLSLPARLIARGNSTTCPIIGKVNTIRKKFCHLLTTYLTSPYSNCMDSVSLAFPDDNPVVQSNLYRKFLYQHGSGPQRLQKSHPTDHSLF